MTISTSLGRFTSQTKFSNKGPKNKHLVPEVHLRAKRLLEISAQEENSAFEVHPIFVCYYRKLKNGKQCTCQIESIDRDTTKQEKSSISLSDFLINTPTLLQTKDNCPICFNTGFIGGYERLGCFSHILDSTSNFETSNISLEKSRPYIFRPNNKEGHITWNIIIPKYFEHIEDLAIRWDIEPSEWRLELNGSIVTSDVLEAEKGNEVEFTLYMREPRSKQSGFFSIFIIYNVANSLIPANFPNITESLTADMNIVQDINTPQSVYFDNTLKQIYTTDMFIDTRYQKIWRVLEIENNDPFSQVIDHKTTCRVCRDFEENYLIPNKLLIGKYPIKDLYTFIL